MNALKYLMLIFLFSACDKMGRNINAMAGVYEVETIIKEYYKNGVIDSTLTENMPGVIALYNNGSRNYNQVLNTLNDNPDAWGENFVGDGVPVEWYTDEAGKPKTITFHNYNSNLIRTVFVTYTIHNSKKNGRMDWVYVSLDENNNIAWTETIRVKKDK